MRSLRRPTITSGEILTQCIESIRDTELTHRLQLAAPTIQATDAEYINHGNQETLYTIPSSTGVAGYVSNAEVERVYKNTFVRSVRTRNIYDSIKKLPENDICPLCGQRTVFSLDHYLPQATQPTLILTPANLVPACGECNKIKLAFRATTAGNQTLHPYFDNVDDDRWLFARVRESVPAALIFSAEPPLAWEEVKRQRIHSHFATFGLGSLYASHSAVELNNIRYRLQQMSRRNTSQEICNHLRESAQSCAMAYPNSWQRATYEALSESEWFCSGGSNI